MAAIDLSSDTVPSHELIEERIYLDVENIQTHMQKIVSERSAHFRDRLVGGTVNAPYGQARSLSGWEGMLSFYRDYNALVHELFRLLRLLRHVLTRRGTWLAAPARLLGTRASH